MNQVKAYNKHIYVYHHYVVHVPEMAGGFVGTVLEYTGGEGCGEEIAIGLYRYDFLNL